jgi:hypothetical protein
MPEQLTRHPEVTLQVLRSAGAQCGAGAAQEILTTCPAERFCKLPGGEVCVFGLADASKMTQISATDWQALSSSMATLAPAPAPDLAGAELVLGASMGLLAGAAIALGASRWWHRHR